MAPPVVRQNRIPVSRKAVVQNEAWGQQKVTFYLLLMKDDE